MTLRKIKAARKELTPFSPERKKVRSLLRKASRGNAHSFVQAVSSYTNLISEYLFLCGVEDETQRIFEVQQVLADCWRYLPYTRRVSDFERFLQVRLERFECQPNTRKLEEPHAHLVGLNHEERFLLAARVLENWSLKSLRLALRLGKKELSQRLMLLKCKLVGFRFKVLMDREQEQVARVSALLEGELTDKQARRTEMELSSHYHAHQYKADWLSYRCELADLRLSITLSEVQWNDLAERITKLIKQQPMEKPKLYDSLINQFSFVRLPTR